jgi:hypothetical protein
LVSVSTFSRALQHGQVISKFGEFFAIWRIIPQNPGQRLTVELDRKDVENAKQLPAQKEDGKQNDENRHEFSKAKAAAVGLEASGSEAKDIQRGKPKNYRPQNIVNIVAPAGEAFENHQGSDQSGLNTQQLMNRERCACGAC